MTLRRSVIAFYALLFVALTMFAGLFFLRTYGQYKTLRNDETASHQRLAELEEQLGRHRTSIEGIKSDPVHVERVIRERLGYAKPDEVVFRFEH